MREGHEELVRRLYEKGDAAEMFRGMLRAAEGASGGRTDSGGIARAFPGDTGSAAFGDLLECLERCVTRKRLSWLERNEAGLERTGDTLVDGFHIFYEIYLGLSVPRDGVIVSADDRRIVTRWWNRCSTLDACLETGLDTRVVCRKAYERPVLAFLARIDPRLSFRRNYDSLRPRAPYCEEIIEIGRDPYPKGPGGLSARAHPFKGGA